MAERVSSTILRLPLQHDDRLNHPEKHGLIINGIIKTNYQACQPEIKIFNSTTSKKNDDNKLKSSNHAKTKTNHLLQEGSINCVLLGLKRRTHPKAKKNRLCK